MKYLIAILIIMLPVPALARERAQGDCMQGGHVAITQSLQSTNSIEESYESCTVTVYNAGTTTLSVIYADNSGTVKGNPFTSDTNGYWYFYADNGRYDVHFSNSTVEAPFTRGDWLLCDPADPNGAFDCGPGASGVPHNLLSTTHLDTIPASPPSRGAVITAQNQTSPSGVNPAWAELTLGPDTWVLTSNGTDALWAPLPSSGGNCGSGGNVASDTACAGPLPDTSRFGATLVQQRFVAANPDATPISLNSPVTLGDQILVAIAGFSYPALCSSPVNGGGSVIDSLGNTFSYVATPCGHYWGIDLYKATVTVAGSDSITVTFNPVANPALSSIQAFEFQDLGIYDSTHSTTGVNLSYFTDSITTTHADETLLGFMGGDSSNSAVFGAITDPLWTLMQNTYQLYDTYLTNQWAVSFAPSPATYTISGANGNIGGLNGQGSLTTIAFFPASATRDTSAPPIFRYLQVPDWPSQFQPLWGRSASLGGGVLVAGACATNDIGVSGANVGNKVTATPETYPGDGFYWFGYIPAHDTVRVGVCSVAGGTPTASFYDVRVEK